MSSSLMGFIILLICFVVVIGFFYGIVLWIRRDNKKQIEKAIERGEQAYKLNQLLGQLEEKERFRKIQEKYKERFNDEWLAIRTQVLKRDNYKCVNCGETGKNLHVHHIKPKSERGTDELDNLVSLCSKCHSVQDSKGHELIKETWECPICSYKNDDENVLCIKCGSHREEPCYDIENDINEG